MDASNNIAIQVHDLVKHYAAVRAVDGISFSVQRGEIFGMLGPNGAGKTTTIECIEGIRRAYRGKIEVLGLDPAAHGRRLRECIGIQFQAAALPDRLKVWEALDLFASFYPQPREWAPLLEQMGLLEQRDAYLAKLSGGQKQRVFIALALVNDPHLVFLDELTTGLDPQARRAMWDLVRSVRAQGKTVFLTTHFMEEAERLCDRVAIIDQGKIVALDSPHNLVASLGGDVRVVLDLANPDGEQVLYGLSGVTRVERIGERVVVYGQKDGLVGRVVAALEAASVGYENLRSESPTLEDVFLRLTGKEIRN